MIPLLLVLLVLVIPSQLLLVRLLVLLVLLVLKLMLASLVANAGILVLVLLLGLLLIPHVHARLTTTVLHQLKPLLPLMLVLPVPRDPLLLLLVDKLLSLDVLVLMPRLLL